MRFQTTETVQTADFEKVLRALEVSLRELSDEIQREGQKITLYGLGPSPRARNYRDTAIFDVVSTKDSTTIQVDVTFQASALLGSSSQDEVVRSKLDYAFEQMRMQLSMPEAAAREDLPEPVLHAAFVGGQPVAVSDAIDELADEAAEPSRLPTAEPNPPPVAPQPGTPFGAWAASLRSVPVPHAADGGSSVEPDVSTEEQSLDRPALNLMATADSHKTNLPILMVILLGVAVAAASVYLYWAGLLNLEFAHRMISTSQPASPAPTPAPVAAVPVPQAPPRHEEPDPKLWLEEWANALRGRDPVLLASFYADPVAQYLGDSDVNRDALTTEFRSAIQARDDALWTVKLERISIAPQSASYVIARLTKHFMQIDDSDTATTSQIADRYVRSRLELRRIDGEWKIVSEQDLIPGNSPVR